MKIAFYPGSFNPFHAGHQNVLDKALKLFDKVVIVHLINPEKEWPEYDLPSFHTSMLGKNVEAIHRLGVTLNTAIGDYLRGIGDIDSHQYAIIRGIRNERDFCDEQMLQYWYEDTGIQIPILYLIAPRDLVHISSSAIRAANKFKGK